MSQNFSADTPGGGGLATTGSAATLPTGTQPTGTATSTTADAAALGTAADEGAAAGAPLGGDDRSAQVVRMLREEGSASVAEIAPDEGSTAHLTLPSVPQDLSHVQGVILDEDRVQAALLERAARLHPNPPDDMLVAPGVTVKDLRDADAQAGSDVTDTRRVEIVNELDADDPHRPNTLSGATQYARTVIEEPAEQPGAADTRLIEQQQVEETSEEISLAQQAADDVREGESPRDAITRAQGQQTADDQPDDERS
jgi:hypothetical protein